MPRLPLHYVRKRQHDCKLEDVFAVVDCRPHLWFWNSVVLCLTLMLAASQVFATALDTYFQLTIMLMILMVGVVAFAHFRPFLDDLLQQMQVGAFPAHTVSCLACCHCDVGHAVSFIHVMFGSKHANCMCLLSICSLVCQHHPRCTWHKFSINHP